MKIRTFGVAAGALAAAIVMSACSGGETANTAAPAAPAAPAAAPAQTAPKPQVLRVAELDGLSPVVVNGKGRTIYRFDKESNDPTKIACTGDCLKTWEPVLAPNGFEVQQGIEEDLVGVIDRPEGGKQLTLNGWALYYYFKDLELGQIAGQGIGDTWFAIAPNGKKAEETGAAQGQGQVQRQGDQQILRVAELDGFSPVVVNGKGRTIYRFEKESNDPTKIACVDDCVKVWEPVLAPNGVDIKTGVEEDLVGAIERPDGGKQLTLNGWPLYYYFKDLKLGQTAGQGIGGSWFAIAPTGRKAEQAGGGSADTGSSSGSSGTYGYGG
jgi:predicted lipoprotein with Yx(FWY)xxD motif